jgi:CDP-2,3-bis-(O-geranylgeranyl)-sn-glycerol synthase
MIEDVLFAIWFLLPAAAANMIPILVAAVPALKKYDAPIDGGRSWRGHRLLGPHKTWRGIIAGIITATVVLWVQQLLVHEYAWAQGVAQGVDYAALPLFILGPLFAIGALGGDAIESFFKRRLNIASGGTWIPFDQVDYIIGSILISLFFVVLSPVQYIWMLAVWFVMHVLASYIGYLLGLKKQPI